MTWEKKYWDIVDRYFWTLHNLGLKSYNLRSFEETETHYLVPKDLLSKTKPIYQRARNDVETVTALRGDEEALNDIFDLTFGIAPDSVLKKLFFDSLAIDDDGPFESLGLEVRQRYGWARHANITQQDGLFVSNKSSLGIEIKLGAKTTPDQIVKNAYLLCLEEQHSGQKENLGLLFIRPDFSSDVMTKECGFVWPDLYDAKCFYEGIPVSKRKNKTVNKFIKQNSDHFYSVLNRMKFGCISWCDFNSSISNILHELDASQQGDQTLHRLLSGFQRQLIIHRNTGI